MTAPQRFAGSDRFRAESAARMTERHLQADVVALAHALGYSEYHTYDSRRSNPGWPDLALWRPGRFLLAELKSQTGRIRPEQRTCLDGLTAAGITTYLWRPLDLLEGRIEAVLRGDQ